MQLKHFEHLANLERSIIKQQFVKAAKAPVPMSYGGKKMKGNVPQVASITALTGDVKIKTHTLRVVRASIQRIPPKNRYATRKEKQRRWSQTTG